MSRVQFPAHGLFYAFQADKTRINDLYSNFTSTKIFSFKYFNKYSLEILWDSKISRKGKENAFFEWRHQWGLNPHAFGQDGIKNARQLNANKKCSITFRELCYTSFVVGMICGRTEINLKMIKWYTLKEKCYWKSALLWSKKLAF